MNEALDGIVGGMTALIFCSNILVNLYQLMGKKDLKILVGGRTGYFFHLEIIGHFIE